MRKNFPQSPSQERGANKQKQNYYHHDHVRLTSPSNKYPLGRYHSPSYQSGCFLPTPPTSSDEYQRLRPIISSHSKKECCRLREDCIGHFLEKRKRRLSLGISQNK
ncbi:hypothetical protein ABK040_003180 [Willaertia magna]